MATTTQPSFKINGVVSPNKTVLQNLQSLASACGCFITFDINQGKWAVIINRAGSSVASFNDSNIIGAINLSGTGVTELYNKVHYDFPHKDLLDQRDWITYEIPSNQRYENEPDNTLNISTDLVNDPVQAKMLALIELKQSRVDKIIRFKTDFSQMGLKAGDLIDVTNEMYGFSAKMFRIISIEEDDENNSINLSITALEYDANVYDFTDVDRYQRDRGNGIVAKNSNAQLTTIDNIAYANSLNASLNDPNSVGALIAALANKGTTITAFTFQTDFFSISGRTFSEEQLFADWSTANNGQDVYYLNKSATIPYTGRYTLEYFLNFGASITYNGSGASDAPATTKKRANIHITRNGSYVDFGGTATTTHPKGSDPYLDISLVGSFSANKGDVIQFFCDIRTDMITGGGGTPQPGVAITGTLTYLGT